MRSAWELSREYVGGSIAINKQMATIREALLGDMVAAGYSENKAAVLVDDHLIGQKKPAQGREGLAASPEIVQLAEELGLLVRRRRTVGRGCREH